MNTTMLLPGLEELGLVAAHRFELALPPEGVAGLPAGFVLRISASPSSPASSPAYRGQAWELALQEVRGLQLHLPMGAWPVSATQPPSVFVLDDSAATSAGGPLALDSSIKLRGRLLVIAPSPVLSAAAKLVLPVNRAVSRDPDEACRDGCRDGGAEPCVQQQKRCLAGLVDVSAKAKLTLAAHQFVQGRWQRLGGDLRKGLDANTPAVERVYSNATHTAGPPDLLHVSCASLRGAVAVMQLATPPVLLAQT